MWRSELGRLRASNRQRLEQVRLEDASLIRRISGRLYIAQLGMFEREIVEQELLDMAEEAEAQSKSLQQELGMAIIMITHDLGVVAQLCDEVIVMYAGGICEQGTADEIFYNPQHEYTKGLINSIPKLNAEEKERLVPIEGQPVDLLNPPAGCPFAPRCKSCMKVCLNKMPPRTELSDTHYTYCWLRQKEEFEKGGKA